jgi:hypothetical protein
MTDYSMQKIVIIIQEVKTGGPWLEGSWAKSRKPYLKNKPVVVAHACNPTYLGGVGRRIRF